MQEGRSWWHRGCGPRHEGRRWVQVHHSGRRWRKRPAGRSRGGHELSCRHGVCGLPVLGQERFRSHRHWTRLAAAAAASGAAAAAAGRTWGQPACAKLIGLRALTTAASGAFLLKRERGGLYDTFRFEILDLIGRRLAENLGYDLHSRRELA